MDNSTDLSPCEQAYADYLYKAALLQMKLAYEPNYVRLRMLEEETAQLNAGLADAYSRLLGMGPEKAPLDFTLKPSGN